VFASFLVLVLVLGLVGNFLPQLSIHEVLATPNAAQKLTVIGRHLRIQGWSVPSNINQTVDNWVASNSFMEGGALVLEMSDPAPVFWFNKAGYNGYVFTPTSGTWWTWSFNQLKSLINRFHYHNIKIILGLTGFAKPAPDWTSDIYNWINNNHQEFWYTYRDGSKFDWFAGLNGAPIAWLKNYTTNDTPSGAVAGQRLIDVFCTRLGEMINAGLQWDGIFGSEGWNSVGNWGGGSSSEWIDASPQMVDEWANASSEHHPSDFPPTYTTIGLGDPVDEGLWNEKGGDIKWASNWQVQLDGNIISMKAYLQASSGTANVKLGIYSGTSSVPNALLGTTNAVSVNTTAMWRTWTFPSNISVTAGEWVWFSVISDATLKIYMEYEQSTHGNNDAYSDGFSNPFGTNTVIFSDKAMHIYVNYTMAESWSSWSNSAKVDWINNNANPQWRGYWGMRMAIDFHRQLAEVFVDNRPAAWVFGHLFTPDDSWQDSTQGSSWGGWSQSVGYNATWLGIYCSGSEFVWANGMEHAHTGGAYTLLSKIELYQTVPYIVASVKSYNTSFHVVPLVDTSYGSQPPIWVSKQMYLSQIQTYVWKNGIRFRATDPTTVMIQYPTNDMGGDFPSWMSTLMDWIRSVLNYMNEPEPVYLGHTVVFASSRKNAWATTPADTPAFTWRTSMNWTTAQWVETDELETLSGLNLTMGTMFLDYGWFTVSSGTTVPVTTRNEIANAFANGSLNVIIAERVFQPSNYLTANEIANYHLFDGGESATGRTSNTILSGISNQYGAWIASGYTGTQTSYGTTNEVADYEGGTGFVNIANCTGTNLVQLGIYYNASTARFMLSLRSDPVEFPLNVTHRALYWASKSPVNTTQPLVDVKVFKSGDTFTLPMMNVKDITQTNTGSGANISTTLKLNAAQLGLGSVSNYVFYWASDWSGSNVMTFSDWNNVPVTLKGMADVLVIKPKGSTPRFLTSNYLLQSESYVNNQLKTVFSGISSQTGWTTYYSSSEPNSLSANNTGTLTKYSTMAQLNSATRGWYWNSTSSVSIVKFTFSSGVEITENFASDTTPPTYDNVAHNTTIATTVAKFSCRWQDNVGLFGFIFAWNGTGSWTNNTWTALSGNPSWANATKTLPVSGTKVSYRWYAQDSSNNWAATGIYTLTTTSIGENIVVLLNTPSDGATERTKTQTFTYTPIFYQTIQNTSLWLNLSGTWQRVAWNTTIIQNNTANSLTYTFSSSGVYVWNIGGYNTTKVVYAQQNRTITLSLEPYYDSIGHSTTVNTQDCTFTCYWHDGDGLSGFIFSWNGTGSWVNSTWSDPWSGTPEDGLASIVKALPAIGLIVRYRFYANDTENKWSSTTIQSFQTTESSGGDDSGDGNEPPTITGYQLTVKVINSEDVFQANAKVTVWTLLGSAIETKATNKSGCSKFSLGASNYMVSAEKDGIAIEKVTLNQNKTITLTIGAPSTVHPFSTLTQPLIEPTAELIGISAYIFLVTTGGFILLGAAALVAVIAFLLDKRWLLAITIALTVLGGLTLISVYITPIF
jgi:hypothetical protein